MIPLRDNVPSRTFPFVNILLILLNAAGFCYELSMPGPDALKGLILDWAVVPAQLLADPRAEWHTLMTSMFLHGGWMHLIGNMLYLWIFGDNVEDRLGHRRYLVYYLVTGAAAAGTQAFLMPASRVPMIGASGAIAGVMGGYFLLYPRARILAAVPIWIFLRFVELPAILFLGFWFLIQALQGWGSIMAGGGGGGVAWWAHAGGFLAGALLVFPFKRR